MCGIFATNRGNLYDNIQVLQSLEYRGYDSAGFVAITKTGELIVRKSKGNVSKLMMSLGRENEYGLKFFMGHTRWATHGPATTINAHPHFDPSGRYAIVMNGILENHLELIKEYSLTPVSETDTEVLISVIAAHTWPKIGLSGGIEKALQHCRGAFACIVLDTHTCEAYAIQRGTKLNWFLVENPDDPHSDEYDGFYAYSHGVNFINTVDRTPGIPADVHGVHFNHHGTIVKLDDRCTDLDKNGDVVRRSDSEHFSGKADKGEYETFMLKEMYEQPEALERLFAGRIKGDQVYLGGIKDSSILEADFVHILACGSSLHAGRLGQMYIEELAQKKTIAEQAAEFRYRNPLLLDNKESYVLISQSGETADVIEALEYTLDSSCLNSVGIINNVGSTLAERSYRGIYTRAGLEVGVASTKTFTNQVATLLMLAIYVANDHWCTDIVENLKKLPKKISKVLNTKRILSQIDEAAKLIAKSDSCLFIGRGHNLPIAQEGALKMKELSYIHAEAYSGAELKHGPLALIDNETPTVALWTGEQSDKIRNNIFEIQSRGGEVILITDTEHEGFKGIQIVVPSSDKYCQPMINAVATQLLAYKTAIILGHNVDQPRNLAKSVTVE